MMFALAILISLFSTSQSSEIPKIDTIKLAAHTEKSSLVFDGTVHPKKIAQVSSLSGGQITQIGVQLGDWVYENQKLIEIDHSRSLLAKKLSENELNIAQQNLKLAKKVFERIHKMHSDSLISEEVYEKAEYEAFAAEARYSAAMDNFDIAQLNLSDSYVKAPFAGQIANIHVGLGETVLPGAPLLRLAATDTALIKATVNANDLSSLQHNQQAMVEWTQGALSFPAKLHAFTNVSNPKNHRYPVELISPNPPESLVFGTLVQVNLTTADTLSGVLINSRALRSFNGQNFAYKIKRSKDHYYLHKTRVSILLELDNGIFLVGRELNEGEEVAAGGALMTDGMLIRIGNVLKIEP